MSVFTSLIILLLATLIQSLLQLSPGLFSIFYHHSLGTSSAKKTDDRSLSFIVGTEITTALVFLIVYSCTTFFILENNAQILLYVMAGIFLFEACFMFFCYFKSRHFKKSKNTITELFFSRRLTSALIHRVEKAKSRSDTILLGLVTAALELIITLPLYIICSVALLSISVNFGFIFIIIYTVAATIPLFCIRTYFRTGHNLAELTRLRSKSVVTLKIIFFLAFIIIAILVFLSALSNQGAL